MRILVTDIPFIYEKDFYQKYDDSILDKVKSVLVEAGYNVEICHAHNEGISKAAFLKMFENACYNLVFVHIFFYRQQFFQEYSQTLRELFAALSKTNPHIHFSGFGRPLLLAANLDDYKQLGLHSFCAGEITSATFSIIERLSSGESPVGLVMGNTEESPQIFSYFTEADHGLNINASTGCAGRCSFCTERLSQGKWQPFNTAEVIRTIQLGIQKYHPNWIKFNDLNFLGYRTTGDNRAYLIKFAELYKEVCGNKIPIKLSTRVDSVDEDILDLLSQIGVTVIFYGIESGVQRILDSFSKDITPEKSLQILEKTYHAGIMPQMGFIFFEPFMTLSEIQTNICFLRESGKFTYLSLQLIDRLRVFKNTAYAKMNCQKPEFHSEIFCYSYKFKCGEVEQYYSVWQAVFKKCKNMDMYIRSQMDLLLLRGSFRQDSNLLEIHKKIMTRYNSLIINTLEKIFYGEPVSSIVDSYSEKTYEILVMLRLALACIKDLDCEGGGI